MPKIGRLLRELDTLLLPRKVNQFCPDIYHTTYYRFPDGIKSPKVLTVYDLIHERFNDGSGHIAEALENKKRCIESSDKVIAISESTRKDLIEHYAVNPEKVVVVHLAAGDAFKPASKDDIRGVKEKYKIDKPFLLYVGQRGGYKNFEVLLKAFGAWKMNSEFELVCVGGKPWNNDEIDFMGRHGLGGKVKLLGYLADEELMGLYSAAAVFVYPSKYEGFGIPLLEAMSCGTPVITCNNSSLCEIAGIAAEYFDAGSAEQLRGALDKVLEDKALRDGMIEKGFKIQKEFSWDNTARKTLAVYKDIVSSAR